MKSDKSVIIVGAGIGGIATSVFLARKGFTVDVYEKNSFPGGRCSKITRDGYRFDTGATMMLMPDTYREVFSAMGLTLEETLNLKKLDDLYTVFFDNGEKLSFTTDKERMRVQLEKIEPGSFKREREYVRKGFDLYKVAFRKLIGRNFFRFFDFFTPSNALLLLKLKTYVNHVRYTSGFFKSRHLQMAYTFQNIYVGQDPFRAPALFSMIPAAELTEGSFFPVGGMYSVAEKLKEISEGLGVRYHFSHSVTSMITEGRKVTGVRFGDGTERKADYVIANADLPYVYNNLLPESRKARRIRKMNYACSALVFHWGLDTRFTQLGQHNVFLSDRFREGLDIIFREKSMGDDPCFYIHAPSLTDATAAPEGCEAMSVEVGVGHLDERHPRNWDEIKEKARKAIFRKLEGIGIPDLEKHIKFEICATPQSWEEAFNITRGSVFGSLGHNIFQMGYFRPHNRDRHYRNLYFTGGSTHPGNGIPMVLLSARLVSERIIRDLNRSKEANE